MKATPNRIVFVGTQMEVAGAQRMLLSQARWFHKHGYSVKAIFFYDKQKLGESWQKENVFPVVAIGHGKPNPFALLVALSKLFRMLRGMDVLISFTPHSNLLSLPIAWLARIPVRIGTHHGHIEGSSKTLSWLHGRLTNSGICTAMVAVSEQVREYEIEREGALANRIIVIENGIEPFRAVETLKRNRDQVRKNLGIEPDTTLLLTVGRLTIQKGHTVLLDAIPEVVRTHPQVKLVFAGDGPQRQPLQAKVIALKLEEHVQFIGVWNEIPELLFAADIFVQPSLWEGLSLALLEALQAGLPVVATRVEGVVDVVEDGRHAILVPVNDAAALAAGIEKLLGDAVLRKNLSENGQARVGAQYSVDAMCSAYEKMISEASHAA